MNQDIRIVIIDDDQSIVEALTEMLELEDFRIQSFSDAEKALASLTRDSPVVLLSDVKMPKMDGLTLLSRIQLLDPELPILLMSGHGDIPMAIEAVRDGAYDFLEKPLNPKQLINQLSRATEKRRLVLENRALKQNLEQQSGLKEFIIGDSAAIKTIRQHILALAQANVDTIIYGETGSGKDVVARALHQFSQRSDRRFIAINCGGISESLIESELFGHEAGSFTGANKRHIGKIEAANGGTLFLDEIETMPMSVQIKLLRVLQDRTIERVGSTTSIPVSLTVIAASKDDLAQLGEEGRFRKDLFYRLNVASLTIPPLKDRPEDILPLFHHYARKAAEHFSRPLPELQSDVITHLLQHTWPGNVRELKNAADRFVLGISETSLASLKRNDDSVGCSYEERMDQFERQLLEQGLRAAQGQLHEAADLLDLSRKTLYRKMKKHQLDKQNFRSTEENGQI
ncbi:sigma-54-dependent transcriptional regulator [Marinomonas fungiae]|uniref:DNA-binding transcriptional response regulator, NtrC family, contains REC, AAA-type ATPase, and a Fis-type DNA-binding domains n=1 Tax=Marinomonas fungiae TaxID=1137284 RepID=A0A0K6II09_9GAMM|nr:sigma-54 dependent transcriptional regulator [Marinomonas fungiae]CUB02739.1 DNA-binding transcriptional response regulator, NtrC family, contains REC, AAA-type ATPase, and a Fis-type DNA-binding domains [Marinomonas fungiae]